MFLSFACIFKGNIREYMTTNQIMYYLSLVLCIIYIAYMILLWLRYLLSLFLAPGLSTDTGPHPPAFSSFCCFKTQYQFSGSLKMPQSVQSNFKVTTNHLIYIILPSTFTGGDNLTDTIAYSRCGKDNDSSIQCPQYYLSITVTS